MELNSSYTSTMLFTATVNVHEKPDDTFGKEYPNNLKNDQNPIAKFAVENDAQ